MYGNDVLLLGLSYSAAGRVVIASTTSTWVPTTTVRAEVKRKSDSTTSR